MPRKRPWEKKGMWRCKGDPCTTTAPTVPKLRDLKRKCSLDGHVGIMAFFCWTMTRRSDAVSCENQDILIVIRDWKGDVQITRLEGRIHSCTPGQPGQWEHNRAHGTAVMRVCTRAPGSSLSTVVYLTNCGQVDPGRSMTSAPMPWVGL